MCWLYSIGLVVLWTGGLTVGLALVIYLALLWGTLCCKILRINDADDTGINFCVGYISAVVMAAGIVAVVWTHTSICAR